MKIKNIITRIIKLVNILINILIGFIGLGNLCRFGTDATMYSDDILRIIWIIAMAVVINTVDHLIIKKVKDF